MAALSFLQRLRITAATRQDWYMVLHALTADGIPVTDSLNKMQTEFKRANHAMRPVVDELILRIRGSGSRGKTSRDVGRQRTFGNELLGLVPTNEALLIEAGEKSGDLAKGLRQAADYVGATNRLGSEIRNALIGPALLLLLLLGILVFFSIEILPTFAEIAPRHVWPKYARWYGAMADAAIPIAIALIAGGTAIVLGYLWLLRNWRGRVRRSFDRSLWPFTSAAQLNSAAMLTSLSGFIGAGVPFSSAVEILAKGSNPFMRTVYLHIGQELRKGRRPYEALGNCHLIDSSYQWLVQLYGQTTDFTNALNKLASGLVEFAIKRTQAVFGVIGFGVKLLIVGFVAWTMATMFGIVGSVKGAGLVSEVINLQSSVVLLG